jgi:outer membrane protein OmpA-like peptidoglycan-associated protein
MKIKCFKTALLVFTCLLISSCALLTKQLTKTKETVIKIEKTDIEYKVHYPFLPIERVRDCIDLENPKSVYDSLTNNIKLKFALKSKTGSYYFGGSKPENIGIWCAVSDSVNGNVYNIRNFSVKESIDLFNQKNAISLVLDHSGSMGNRAYMLQDAVIELIKNKRKEDSFNVIKFDLNTNIREEVPFLNDRNELLEKFRRNGLAGYGGATALNDALAKAVGLLSSQKDFDNRIVLVFTDGEENNSIEKSVSRVISQAAQANVKFYVIDFGNETNMEYNRQLAKGTNGKTFKIYQSVEINTIFDEIYGDLTMGPLTYEVAYTPVEPLGLHFPKIKLCFDYCSPQKEFPSAGFNQNIILLNIYFENAVSDVNDAVHGIDNMKEIRKVAKYLKENPKYRIRLEGHTDCNGSAEYNRVLSVNRANSVQKELNNLGIDIRRIETKGYGFEQPHALTADDLKSKEILRQNMLIGTSLNCDLVNKITDKTLKDATHELNRRTNMVILR